MKSLKIKKIKGYELIDSRGNPTVACSVLLKDGSIGKAIVPSGASTGEKEALELRDHDQHRFHGKGVLKAIENINNKISPLLIGIKANKQLMIDKILNNCDGTINKNNLGANATLAVSLAVANAAANSLKKPLYRYIHEDICSNYDKNYVLPVPMMNVINGGAHANNNLDFQEFMIVPIGANKFKEAIRMASEVFYELEKILSKNKLNTSKGDEGGFAPEITLPTEAFELMSKAIKNAGYKLGFKNDFVFAIDVAASEFYDKKTQKYIFKKALKYKPKDKSLIKSTDQMIEYLVSLTKKYPIISIEDGLDQNDIEGFRKLHILIGKNIQIVGDDLYCTNARLVINGIENKLSNAVLIKPNQIGTLSETLETISIAQSSNWGTIISHRSGDTEDTFIADLAVGTNAKQIKTGSLSRSERIAKYNRLIEIEHQLGSYTKYGSINAFNNIYKK